MMPRLNLSLAVTAESLSWISKLVETMSRMSAYGVLVVYSLAFSQVRKTPIAFDIGVLLRCLRELPDLLG